MLNFMGARDGMQGGASSYDGDDASVASDDGVNISSTTYADKCKKLMDMSKSLRDMGAGVLISTPILVVIGSQSAGKSSLVEAVSGITVPRDSGTCTRCPMECSMSRTTDAWSCSISLRFDYDLDGSHSHQSAVPFGPTLRAKSDVEIWLRRAQAAILSPHVRSETFHKLSYQELRNTAADRRTLKFSKNVVVVDIQDPDATDLSFVDLPGLIQNEDQEMIDLVRDLVDSYIEHERALILVAIPMTSDWQSHEAVRLAKDVDPDGERTIGILTKPDAIPPGATSTRAEWKAVLEGKIHKLKYGYYCVRLPDEDERSRHITRAESQQLAANFFDSYSPWKEVADRSRFGIPSFVNNISRILVEHIKSSLPTLKQEVERLLGDCRKGLERLPPGLKTKHDVEVLRRINEFCDDLRGVVSGEGHDKRLARASRECYSTLQQEILSTAPEYENTPLSEIRNSIQIATGWELPHTVPYAVKPMLIKNFAEQWRGPAISCFNDVFVLLSDTIDRLIKKHFGDFSGLENHMGSLAEIEIDRCRIRALNALDNALALELERPYTQNLDYSRLRKQWLHRFRSVHLAPSSGDASSPLGSVARSPLGTLAGMHNIANVLDFLDDVLGFHDMPEAANEAQEEELMVMAEVRAYFHIAYKRFIDYIPMTIEYSLSHALAKDLRESFHLAQHELNREPEKMEVLLRGDPDLPVKKERFETRKRRLMEVKQKLDEFKHDS